MALRSINPATGELLESFSEQTPAQAAEAVAQADEAFSAWSAIGFPGRGRLLLKAAKILRADKNSLARMMSEEMGKPILQALAEIEKCALVCDYYAENGPAMLAPERIATEAAGSYVRFDPLAAT
jgi:succinate-semialdehyde dehydrogenase/glutarate-semialdehyde dehydrogenase